MKIKQIKLDDKFDRIKSSDIFFLVVGFLITSCFSFLLGISYSTPVTPSFDGYIMNFRGERIKVVQEVKAEEKVPEITLDEYVVEKFGHDAWKAFAILHGTKYCGGENGKHDPNAYNINNDPEKTEDWGYWQFNDKWHPEVTRECAKDVKCSTDRAYEMFKHDKGFKQWTAGKCIGL